MTDQELIEKVRNALVLEHHRKHGDDCTFRLARAAIAVAEPIIAKREREKVLREMLEPSEAIIEAGAEGYHEAKDAKRKAYNARHAYRIERGDSVPIFSACPADWLEETWQAMLRAFARAQGLEL